MEKLIHAITMITLMHFLQNWLFASIILKFFNLTIPTSRVIIYAFAMGVTTYFFKDIWNLLNLPTGLFYFANLGVVILMQMFVLRINWRYASLGVLTVFAVIVLWSPLAYMTATKLDWKFPNPNILINILGGYLEIFGVLIIALILKVKNINVSNLSNLVERNGNNV